MIWREGGRKMKTEFKILIDGGGTATAISVIKGLKKQKKYQVKITVIDIEELNAGRFLADNFYKVPPASNERFTEVVLDICKKEKIDIFVPIIDLAFLKLAENVNKFNEAGVFLLLSNLETIKIVANKLKTFEFFKKENIPTPEVFRSVEDIKAFPIFIKPKIGGRASINTFKVENKREVEFYLSKIPDPLLQEYIEGEEFTADCLNSLDGSFIECVIRKRIETKGGLSIKAEIVSSSIAQEIKKYITKFSEKLKLIGAYNVQGFIKKDGSFVFTEINPRFAGTHAFTIEAGLNSIKYILEMLNGKKKEEIKKEIFINYDLKMVRYWDEIFIDNNGKVYNPWGFWK